MVRILISLLFILILGCANSVFADCISEGNYFQKGTNVCCEGLKEVPYFYMSNGECKIATESVVFCKKCGDSICDISKGESYCDCPEDCSKPSEELKTPEEQKIKPEVEEGITQEKEELKQSFFSNLAFKIIIITILFLIVGIILFFVYKKRSTTPEKPSGIIEEPESKETNPTEQPKIEKPKKEQVCPMLLEYIKTNLDKGFTKEQIKEALVKAGWNAKEVDKALAQF